MGAFYRSYSIPDDVHEVAEQKITTWLSRKGFSEIEGSSVLDDDMEGERGFYLFWNDRWTIILYSDFEEDERLLFELNLLQLPILHLWLLDSDVWGYELYMQRKPIAAFNSQPKYYGSDDLSDVPNDIPTLLAKCSLKDLAVTDIAAIQRKRGVFKDPICAEFASAIHAGPAAAQYAYVTEGFPNSAGFSCVHRRFRKRNYDPVGSFDLHLRRAKSTQSEAFPLPQAPPLSIRILALIMRIVATPLGWLLRFSIMRRIKSGDIPADSSAGIDGQSDREYTFEEGRLVNPKRRCRIDLPEGAVHCDGPGILPFKIGNHKVIVRAISANEAMTILSGSQYSAIEEDSNFWIGSLPAKYVLASYKVPQRGQETNYSHQFFIQAPFAIYRFLLVADSALSHDELSIFRKTVESFTITEPDEIEG